MFPVVQAGTMINGEAKWTERVEHNCERREVGLGDADGQDGGAGGGMENATSRLTAKQSDLNEPRCQLGDTRRQTKHPANLPYAPFPSRSTNSGELREEVAHRKRPCNRSNTIEVPAGASVRYLS